MRHLREAQRTSHDRAAFKVLGFEGDPDAVTVQELDSKWRELRSTLHPDKPTGDAVRFDECRKAYEAARFYALEPKPCVDCKGSGKKEVMGGRGFAQTVTEINCTTCKGSGQR